MTDKMLKYKSLQRTVNDYTGVLETIDRDGIVCIWNGTTIYAGGCYKTNFSWNFDWSKLKDQGVERITGYLIVRVTENNLWFGEHKIDIDFKETPKIVTKDIQYNSSPVYVTFEYRLTPHYAQKIDTALLENMFAASEMNDTALVIEGKKVHVNKVFLSYHSEFFRALFSSNFKEGQMTEIPIEEITYEDFGLLMSTIYPDNVFPTDRTAEKLLELADRFLMRFVIRAVEHHLLEHSNISNERLMWMADAYKMPKLLEKCVDSMDTVDKVKALGKSEEYGKLSNNAKSSVSERIIQFF